MSQRHYEIELLLNTKAAEVLKEKFCFWEESSTDTQQGMLYHFYVPNSFPIVTLGGTTTNHRYMFYREFKDDAKVFHRVLWAIGWATELRVEFLPRFGRISRSNRYAIYDRQDEEFWDFETETLRDQYLVTHYPNFTDPFAYWTIFKQLSVYTPQRQRFEKSSTRSTVI